MGAVCHGKVTASKSGLRRIYSRCWRGARQVSLILIRKRQHARSKRPPPEKLDYLGALQCGGLSWALQAAKHADTVYSDRYSGQTDLFLHWAEAQAREAGQDFTAAKRDMVTIRDGILATAKGITADRKSESISREFRGEQNACDVMAYDPAHAFVIIGG